MSILRKAPVYLLALIVVASQAEAFLKRIQRSLNYETSGGNTYYTGTAAAAGAYSAVASYYNGTTGGAHPAAASYYTGTAAAGGAYSAAASYYNGTTGGAHPAAASYYTGTAAAAGAYSAAASYYNDATAGAYPAAASYYTGTTAGTYPAAASYYTGTTAGAYPAAASYYTGTTAGAYPAATSYYIGTTAVPCSEEASYYAVWGTGLCHDPCTCGIPNRKSTRIINGQPTQVNEYPWAVALLFRDFHVGAVSHHCGGTLITDRHVLTAAHCVDEDKEMMLKSIIVVLGGHYMTSILGGPSYTEERRFIKDIILSPNFQPDDNKIMDNDIALILLSSPVQFSSVLSPACLPTYGEDFANQLGTVFGWGKKETGFVAQQLHSVDVPILSQDDCREKTVLDSAILTDNMMCAGMLVGGGDSCEGDSGGGLMVTDRRNRSVVAGVVSWGIGCGKPYAPGVYTRVNRYLPWIHSHTKDGCFCG